MVLILNLQIMRGEHLGYGFVVLKSDYLANAVLDLITDYDIHKTDKKGRIWYILQLNTDKIIFIINL